MKRKILGTIFAGLLTLAPMTTLAEPIPIRGVVEGFYGTTWTHENRVDMLQFCGNHDLNAYIYAPKDDLYHRAKWREPYPQDKLNEIASLVKFAKTNKVKFIFAVSPGLDINYSSKVDMQIMIEKLLTMYNIGVRDFAIFFDDIEDKDGIAQATFLNLLQKNFVEKYNDIAPLITVPTEYFRLDMIDSNGHKAYTDNFSMILNPDILVLYTGEGVVQPAITDEQYKSANDIYNRNLGIWWNYPVTDYMEAKLALGAIENLPQHSSIPAIFFNPMKHEQLSKIALATGADYAKNPEHYDAYSSWNKAIDEQFGKLAEAMKIFAAHSQHLENNWANVGRPDGNNLREEMNKLLQTDSASNFNNNYQVVNKQLNLLKTAIKKLQTELPVNILNECRLQLEQFALIVEADQTALKLLKCRRSNKLDELKQLESKLKKQLEDIKLNEKNALVSDKTCRAFIDEVLQK